jgi:endonuclease YncB( thermonuclease family)
MKMLFMLFLTAAWSIAANQANANTAVHIHIHPDKKQREYVYSALEVKAIRYVYDGRNFMAKVPEIGSRVAVQIANIAVPEKFGTCTKESKLAFKAKDYLESQLKRAHKVRLYNIRLVKADVEKMYNTSRMSDYLLLADVIIDKRDVRGSLFKLGYAVSLRYEYATDWC